MNWRQSVSKGGNTERIYWRMNSQDCAGRMTKSHKKPVCGCTHRPFAWRIRDPRASMLTSRGTHHDG